LKFQNNKIIAKYEFGAPIVDLKNGLIAFML